MFEQINSRGFLNREHTGEYAEIEFDTYVSGRGTEEIESITTGIHYHEKGEGLPLILVHGIGQSAYTWRKNFEELSEHFHVYAIDLPGHGFSGRPQISYSIEEMALAIEAFMNAMELPSASFCAFAESTGYVLDFAQHNPERVDRLIFISPMVSVPGRGRSRGILSVFGSIAQKMMLNLQTIKSTLEDCYFDRTLVTDQVAEEYFNVISDKDFKIIARLSISNFIDEDVVAAI
ncbi:MAG: alpha/beta fold hydrolase, partial [Christensenellaceae bacterium]